MSGGHGGQLDEGIVAQRSHGWRYVVAPCHQRHRRSRRQCRRHDLPLQSLRPRPMPSSPLACVHNRVCGHFPSPRRRGPQRRSSYRYSKGRPLPDGYTTIGRESTPPSATSPQSRQRQNPHNLVSTFPGEGQPCCGGSAAGIRALRRQAAKSVCRRASEPFQCKSSITLSRSSGKPSRALAGL